MTREEMREKVARALAETQGEIVNDAWRFYLDDADAAIAIIRGETLEEAARECDVRIGLLNSQHDVLDITRECDAYRIAAAAIRELARPNNGLTEPSAEVSAIP